MTEYEIVWHIKPKVVTAIELTKRQERILRIVQDDGPITGEQIAEKLSLTRATLRPDLAILTMSGFLDARPRVGYFYSGKSTNALIAEKFSKISVGALKAVPVVVREEVSAYDAAVTMFLEDVGTLFVVGEGGILEGVVSRKDFLKTSMGGMDMHKIPIGVIMTRMPNIVTITPDESVFRAAQKLIVHEVDALPVVVSVLDALGQEKLEVVGRLTKTSITRLFVELGEGR